MSGERDFGEDEELERIKERKLRKLARKRSGHGAPGIVMLDGERFDEFVSRSSVPVLVDFFAVWCPPCKMMEPVIERLAEEFAGKVAFGKVDVDENMELAARFEVSAVPTFILFKGGKMLGRIVGARDYNDFKEILEEAIKG